MITHARAVALTFIVALVAYVAIGAARPAEVADGTSLDRRAMDLVAGRFEGQDFPIFLETGPDEFTPSLPVYLTAASLALTGWAALPAIVAAAGAVALAAAIAGTTWATLSTMVAAAALTSVTPALLASGTVASSAVFQLVCLLAWLWTMVEWERERRTGLAVVGGMLLGLSLYTDPSAMSLAVMAAAASAGLMAWHGSGRSAAAVAAGFAAACLPLVAWLAAHPDDYANTVGRWLLHLAHVRNPVEGIEAAIRWPVLSRRTSAYWDYFNPEFMFGARHSGFGSLLLVPAAPLVGVGAAVLLTGATPHARWMRLALLLAPAGGVLLDQPRSAPVFLFGAVVLVLTGISGFHRWTTTGGRPVRAAAWLVLGLAVAWGAVVAMRVAAGGAAP